MTVGSLFSGIGGFDRGLEHAGMEIVFQVEIDPFCNKVLAKHWPNVRRYANVKEVHGYAAHAEHNGYDGTGDEGISTQEDGTRRMPELKGFDGASRYVCGKCLPPVDLLCGGPPCQPASVAGKRGGTTDDRWLWPETLRLVRELAPRWCLFENPTGILSLEGGIPFEAVLSDLESQGYEVQSFIIPACAVGAPHRRDRVWIIAKYAQDNATDNGLSAPNAKCGRTDRKGRIRRQGEVTSENRQRSSDSPLQSDCHATDTKQFSGDGIRRLTREPQTYALHANDNWQEHWYEVATRLCRVDDGLPRQMDRVNRLKALGNAVVPQIVTILGQAIIDVERANERM